MTKINNGVQILEPAQPSPVIGTNEVAEAVREVTRTIREATEKIIGAIEGLRMLTNEERKVLVQHTEFGPEPDPYKTDLKIIDELLCAIRQMRNLTPEQLENYDYTCHHAMRRLREAWKSGEMKLITMTWSEYFKRSA